MKDTLLIVFVKNIVLGKVKTRLAKTIGNEAAFEVYKHIVKHTESETEKIQSDVKIYFSDSVVDTKWKNRNKYVQSGKDLGERMKNAFKDGFNEGYKRIVLIGSDLPEISCALIEDALENLNKVPVVFGPAEDGGYYLVGLSKIVHSIFDDKEWSTDHLLENTLNELRNADVLYELIREMNDVDTIEDLRKSSISHLFPY